jgi:hypothetical protein
LVSAFIRELLFLITVHSLVLLLILTVCSSLYTRTDSSQSAVLQRSSGAGFQRQTFPFLGSRTIFLPQSQQLLTYSVLNFSGTDSFCHWLYPPSYVPLFHLSRILLSCLVMLVFKVKVSKLYYDPRSVGQTILSSGTRLGPETKFYPSFFNYF